MPKTMINPPELMKPIGSYSQVVIAPPGKLVFIAGQTAELAPDGSKIAGLGDIRAQTRQVLEHVKKGVEAAGGTMDDIVAYTIYITDARWFKDVNETRREFLGKDFATSTMVQVVGLAKPGLLVEINAIAVVPERRENRKKA